MKKNKTSISKARSYAQIGEFWDKHDLSEFWSKTKKSEIRGSARARSNLLSDFKRSLRQDPVGGA